MSIFQEILFICSALLTLQGLVTLMWMLYAWEDPDKAKKRKSPEKYYEPELSFTALVPVRDEAKVISDTVKAIDAIDYPKKLKEIIVICRFDDTETIKKAKEIIAKLGNPNNKLLIIGDVYPINKPTSLNIAFKHAGNQIVTIFDAEDEPHPDIYKIINTVFIRDKADVIQSGVQLMNYNSHWFSPLNVMEYYLWFKSGLNFFTDIGNVSMLGGNTVFFKKSFLTAVGGWDQDILTEDADIGIRLTRLGARTSVIYDERHATKEETPATVGQFIKQRTRWNQGFLQILVKGDWLALPKIRQKIIGLYVLLAPFFPLLMLIYLPFGMWVGFELHSKVFLALFTFVPFYVLLAVLSVQVIGLYEFTKHFKTKFSLILPFKILLSYFPYTMLLTIAAVRALFRFIGSENLWEKTSHLNVHRQGEFSLNENI